MLINYTSQKRGVCGYTVGRFRVAISGGEHVLFAICAITPECLGANGL